jgi:hypothetical protein
MEDSPDSGCGPVSTETADTVQEKDIGVALPPTAHASFGEISAAASARTVPGTIPPAQR